ncbi:MAG: SUMF1/EgtB/PvdO family nonheme iron enzyme [FCB group bacterium]|nr:SUMF1/EgtB/PvdO family nonheme iron enzyme [FCB group bacterium]
MMNPTKVLFHRGTAVLLLMAMCALLTTGCPGNRQTINATFDSSAWIGDNPLTVTFTDHSDVTQSKAAAPATITGWQWDFGDGQTSTDQNPVHIYTAPGAYTVSLTVTASNGKTSTLSRPDLVVVLDPQRTQGTTAGETRTVAGIEFVWVPAGTFLMGDAVGLYEHTDAIPQHSVTISRGFWMSKYEVSEGLFTDVMGYDPSFFDNLDDTAPVDSVAWNVAQAFVDTLNEGDNGIFRLPSEAEWEYACRAGTTTQFYFGDSPDTLGDYGWYISTSPYAPQLSGQLLPNAWGLYDMHGNMGEWTRDAYDEDYYTADPATDPTGPLVTGGAFRVLRGGSFRDPAHSCVSFARFGYMPSAGYDFMGIRLVLQ